MATNTSPNFSFLSVEPTLLKQVMFAEKYCFTDPSACMWKIRLFAEMLAKKIASHYGLYLDRVRNQMELLQELENKKVLNINLLAIFHHLRKKGNKATHEGNSLENESIAALRMTFTLAGWYYKVFHDEKFRQKAFINPPNPTEYTNQIHQELAKTKHEMAELQTILKGSAQLREKEQEELESVKAERLHIWKEYEQTLLKLQETQAEAEKDREAYEQEMSRLQENNKDQTKELIKESASRREKASESIKLSEEDTRKIIDGYLSDAGWKAHSVDLTYEKGGRPEKGKNMAIAEWPVKNGRADYVLFAGLVPLAIVEAKRKTIDVSGAISQAERYSRDFVIEEYMIPSWAMDNNAIPREFCDQYRIPFVYSCNGRPYVKQLKESSGTWFRDLRYPSNVKDVVQQFHSPDGLIDKIKRDYQEAAEKLKKENFAYLRLRDYQVEAIKAVEKNIESGQRHSLLAMATGTGKTRTIIGLIYRLLKAERFRRILFLVDRTSLGEQALDTFKEAPLEQNLPLSKIYPVAELGAMNAEVETRVQAATVQAMVIRIFKGEIQPPVDTYDCIIVDEAHRGYTLDQEMTEGEMMVRDPNQYLSSYRRVLDYFDATIIGLTATPAKHTTEIFGKPVYTYSYREAVIDDWLIDHEPPIRYTTKLSQEGIHFDKGSTVSVINRDTSEVETADLEDELDFDVEAFNKKVITPNFNKVICEQLVKEIDPMGDEKTLIFCATDKHADMVEGLLSHAFKEVYGEEYNGEAVKKITGASDNVSQLIKRYKNERYPSVAITVDLLTTGIDVPSITNLVFLRRVKSRILYEQMIGRATRRCDEIGKTVFKIYDPVDIYSALEKISTMKPLVADPTITLEQLIDELDKPEAYTAPGYVEGTTYSEDILAEISQKVMRTLRKATKAAENIPSLKNELATLEESWGISPSKLHKHLKKLGPKEAHTFITEKMSLVDQLNQVKRYMGTIAAPIIAPHEDVLIAREQNYGSYNRPDDYLDSFVNFIKSQINESAALAVVVNQPKNLTREDLKSVKVLLDKNGFSEAQLKTAWRDKTNVEIGASIVGYIRQAALGESLIPFDQRVDHAMKKIYEGQTWSIPQKKWLDRLGKQLKKEIVINEEFVNTITARHGGVKQVNKILDNKLNNIIETLTENLWGNVG